MSWQERPTRPPIPTQPKAAILERDDVKRMKKDVFRGVEGWRRREDWDWHEKFLRFDEVIPVKNHDFFKLVMISKTTVLEVVQTFHEATHWIFENRLNIHLFLDAIAGQGCYVRSTSLCLQKSQAPYSDDVKDKYGSWKLGNSSQGPSVKHTYHAFSNIKIEPLRISEGDLNTKRMLDLMAVSRDGGPMPLYLHAVYRILREMRIEQQEIGTAFSYANFKERVALTEMTPAQLSPLTQRLETLESFMPDTQTGVTNNRQKSKVAVQHGNDWTNKDMTTGRIVALDEAHKFMNESAEAETLTGTLLSTIRLQRHLGARVIICTQEPTISPALLDLCSVTIVHRFTSPEWMRNLKAHLAAVAPDMADQALDAGDRQGDLMREPASGAKNHSASLIFKKIVGLGVGEALIFSPSAMIDVDVASDGTWEYVKLNTGFLKVRVRTRPTTDGGKSVLAA
ncbi:hypothetical protein V491_01432 [Pseudogymnoascus sp. VKM F-3775]|nr:hypothetical protein V491_01432 [Pseudogymnoascus sp. VKM F-3775]